eukprot:5414767-Alexandrium_andersonii.AAC.1
MGTAASLFGGGVSSSPRTISCDASTSISSSSGRMWTSGNFEASGSWSQRDPASGARCTSSKDKRRRASTSNGGRDWLLIRSSQSTTPASPSQCIVMFRFCIMMRA